MKKIKRKMNWKSQLGFSLAEVLVAMALMGIIGTAFLGALSTSSKTMLLTDVKQTARNIAEMQMEAIKSGGHYSTEEIEARYPGFSVPAPIIDLPREPDSNLQKIVVNVYHSDELVYSLVSYKQAGN